MSTEKGRFVFEETKYYHHPTSGMASDVQISPQGMYDQAIRKEIGERQGVVELPETRGTGKDKKNGDWKKVEYIF